MPTPDRHGDASDQSAPAHRPSQDQRDPSASKESTGENVSTPDPKGARVAEAGNAYMGRELDDRLQSADRVLDGDAAETEDDEPTGT
jgi:hypothetical protein